MKVLLMLFGDDAVARRLPPKEMEALVARHGAVADSLREAGKLVGSGRLRFSDEACTLRPDGSDWAVLDGPYAETKEQLGGFYLIDVDSMGEAVEWAKRLPQREDTAIEVRPCRTGSQWSGPLRGTAKYLILFVASGREPMTRDEVFRSIDRHYDVSIELASQGRFVASRSLDPPAAATTVRFQDGHHVVTDGPFAETKEFAAGYFIVSTDNRDEATEWARRLSLGSAACEVRPLWG